MNQTDHSGHIELEADPSSVKRARQFVAATLAGWNLDDIKEVATLLTSELVTNTVLHARTAFRLSIAFDPPEVTVEVRDGSPTLPTVNPPPGDSERGRGLAILATLAARWGVRREGKGKAVWFSLLTQGGPGGLSGPAEAY